MKYQTPYSVITLVIITLLLTACGGSNQLVYQVTGAAGQAEVTYTDGDGNSQTETVTLPWETGFSVGSSADFSLVADNITEQGDISCAVLLNDKELGRADANYYVSCRGSFKKSGSSLSTNFSSSKDVLPDGSAAGPQATDTPVPPTPTPDITADFVAYTSEAGTVSFGYPPDWVTVDNGSGMIAVLSAESAQETLLEQEDFSQPAGFVVGEIGLTSDYGGDDPAAILTDWLAGAEEDWQIEPEGEIELTDNDTIRQASRDYTGTKDGQNLYFRAIAIVNGGNVAVFIGGRTGASPEEHDALAMAILDTLAVEYVDPVMMPQPGDEVAVDVFVESRIVFASDRDGNSEIYTVNTDGSDLTRLTDNPAFDGEPDWSPDGTRVLFVSNRDGNYEIYSMQADGSDVTRLTDEPANDFTPKWSPNGQLIAFMTERNGNADIYLMRPDGSEATPLIASQGHELSPTWSHVTQELAFVSNQATGMSDLYIANTKGEVRQVTEGIGNVFAPNWSPNGRFIAFTGEIDQNFDVYIISPDGTNLQQITTDKAKDYLPKWSPDNNYIMFVSERDGNPDIYITNDSGDLLRVTDNSTTDTVPGWGPQN
jgi:Tol biopolymer transport system component